MQNELLRCPFCGSAAELAEEHDHFWIKHDGCSADLGAFSDASEATGAWNRRALSASPSDAERHERAVPVAQCEIVTIENGAKALTHTHPNDWWVKLPIGVYGIYAAPPPPAAVQEPVAVKALEWARGGPASVYGLNSFTAHPPAGGEYVVRRMYSTSAWTFRDVVFDTADQAKAAAQADYEQRIRSAISPFQSDPAPDALAGFPTAPLETSPQHRDTDAAIRLGAAVLARIDDQAVREIAIRNALTAAAVDVSHSASAAPEMASPGIEERIATVADCNAAFDPADEAFGGAFRDGFREGWIFAKSPDFEDREEAEADYPREVDMAPTECWDAYRSHYFAKLPLAAIPEVGSVISLIPAPEIAALREENAELKSAAIFLIDRLDEFETEMPEHGRAFREYAGHVHPAKSRLYRLSCTLQHVVKRDSVALSEAQEGQP